ncbi:MAG: 50S ribosomal protein L30 [Promethearchaeota archaeon CR_4]|nr:MAG: 50S ribosomal protein L30 [Candidatus Lokiarchaeota archaeon CR_4]
MPIRKKKDQQVKDEFDLNRNINVCAKTGKILMGERSIIKHLGQETMKLVVFANNCPENIKKHIHKYAKLNSTPVPLFTYQSSSIELGLALGKPFMVAALGIVDEGDSEILKVSPQV